jgi:hypothetical protein
MDGDYVYEDFEEDEIDNKMDFSPKFAQNFNPLSGTIQLRGISRGYSNVRPSVAANTQQSLNFFKKLFKL